MAKYTWRMNVVFIRPNISGLNIDDESCWRPNYNVPFPSESIPAFHNCSLINIYLLQNIQKFKLRKKVYITFV